MSKARLLRVIVAFAAVIGLVYAGSAAAPGNSGAAISEHQRIIDFWTPERVAKAIPRDFVFDPSSRRFGPAKKPDNPGGGGHGGGKPGGGGSNTTVLGASWKLGGTVADTTGKVLFELGGSYWVCSASVVQDSKSDRSIVLTAGHCVYDETNGVFATNWMFIPNYDAAPAPLSTTSTSFCDQTKYGCWTASALAVHDGFASAGGFNDQAVLYDFGFAALGLGGKTGEFVETHGTQAISYSSTTLGDTTWAFGYPAAGKYKGKDLVYCKGPLDTDPLNAGKTYRLGCKMTGGSSGGPWFQPFTETSGEGTVISLNSYGYSGISAMHGPKFSSATEAVFTAASRAVVDDTPSNNNVIVP